MMHPFALVRLQAWFDEGWEAWTGRAPAADDYVFPTAEGKPWRPRAAEQVRLD